MVSYPTWVFYGLTVVGLLMLRQSVPHLPRPYAVWDPAAYFFLLICFFVAVFPFLPPVDAGVTAYPHWLPPLLACVVMGLGCPAWWVLVRSSPPAPPVGGVV
jgi:amino acid transporter